MQTKSVSLTENTLITESKLLPDNAEPDWQSEDISVLDKVLSGESFTVSYTTDSTGSPLTQTDARSNIQRQAYDIAGQIKQRWLKINGKAEQVLVRSLSYSAAGQMLREEAGNGVVTTYIHEPETQRLIRIQTARPSGHPAGAVLLQDLHYQFDPAGNVVNLRNEAEITQFWRNQRIEPKNTYVYDSLYQLVKATGHEAANAGQSGIQLPAAIVPLPNDSSVYTNYTRLYSYDRNGNLMQIQHSAPASGNNHTTKMTVSSRSNRAVLSTLTQNPDAVDALFDTGGHQLQLIPGQIVNWNIRGELERVTPTASTQETYRYHSDGQRVIKTNRQQTGNSIRTQQTRYLTGLELRATSTGETVTEAYAVITAGKIRALNWTTGQPSGIKNGALRYSHDDLTGSAALETDEDGLLISREEYYPFGGTALWSSRSNVEAHYKTLRYSGQERDATGLYYYGMRYYKPWEGRWLSADPAGDIDGLNLFRMVGNNPVSQGDFQGMAPVKLLYGMEEVRKSYIEKQKDEPLIRIDYINSALKITPDNLPNIIGDIKKGIKVTDNDVKFLVELVDNKITLEDSKEILTSWSAFLKKNYNYISLAEKSKKIKNPTEFILKNAPTEAEIGRLGGKVSPAVLAEVTPQIDHFLKLGNKKGFKKLEENLSGDDPHKNIAFDIFANSFFRKTSKLGLDWAYSKGSPIGNGVDFLLYSQRGQFTEEALNSKPWKDYTGSYSKRAAGPITFSEYRHAVRKGYAINKINQTPTRVDPSRNAARAAAMARPTPNATNQFLNAF